MTSALCGGLSAARLTYLQRARTLMSCCSTIEGVQLIPAVTATTRAAGRRHNVCNHRTSTASTTTVVNWYSRSSNATAGLGYNVLPKSDVNDLKAFDSIFPDVVQNLISFSDGHLRDFAQHYKKMLEYNVPYGKKLRGLAMVASYKMLHRNTTELTKEQIYLANLMGWCIEMFQAFFLVADDIMDQSQTRRGKPCWFRSEGIGLSAFNDAILLQAGMFKFLKECFGDQPYYWQVLELFNEVYWKTTVGQSLDLLSCLRHNGLVDFSRFTLENYSFIVKFKTSYYSFYLPVGLALHMNGISDPAVHAQAGDILLQIGHLFQVQDDFLDCFGTPSETGKLGTDIAEGKCSWPAVTALQIANSDQAKIMMENYGKPDSKCVKRVLDLYSELKLPAVYADYEQSRYKNLMHQFHKCCVDPWLLEHKTCPMCKMDILKYYGLVSTGSQESILQIEIDDNMMPTQHVVLSDSIGHHQQRSQLPRHHSPSVSSTSTAADRSRLVVSLPPVGFEVISVPCRPSAATIDATTVDTAGDRECTCQ